LKSLVIVLEKLSTHGKGLKRSFTPTHVYITLQLLYKERQSRKSLHTLTHIGEGALRTLLNDLKKTELITTIRSGTILSEKGRAFMDGAIQIIGPECTIPECSIGTEKYNFVVLLRNSSNRIKSGIEQRDAAIIYGATSATTMKFHEGKFVLPEMNMDCLQKESKIKSMLQKLLEPKEGDVIIIASSPDPFIAEISAKNSMLTTIKNS
jgi:hypothetical protein